jgi:hypothetical protein
MATGPEHTVRQTQMKWRSTTQRIQAYKSLRCQGSEPPHGVCSSSPELRMFYYQKVLRYARESIKYLQHTAAPCRALPGWCLVSALLMVQKFVIGGCNLRWGGSDCQRGKPGADGRDRDQQAAGEPLRAKITLFSPPYQGCKPKVLGKIWDRELRCISSRELGTLRTAHPRHGDETSSKDDL